MGMRMRGWWGLGVGAVGLVAGVVAAPPSVAATAPVERVTVDQAGGEPDGSSSDPTVSADGRFVAFLSQATDLVSGDGNGVGDVYVRDRLEGRTIRVTVGADGGDSNGESREPRISADGRFVAFTSLATNLLPASEPPLSGFTTQVFVRDLRAGTTALVSATPTGGPGEGDSREPSISTNGRFVAFTSASSDLAPGGGAGPALGHQVFVRDMKQARTIQVSVGAHGEAPDRSSESPSISGNGRFVGYMSFAFNLVDDGASTNPDGDIYRLDRASGKTTRMTAGLPEREEFPASFGAPELTFNGRHVTYLSGFIHENVDARDLPSGASERISVQSSLDNQRLDAFGPRTSDTGRFVVWRSSSPQVPEDQNNIDDVYVRDTDTGTVTRISVAADGGDTNDFSFGQDISADGTKVVFSSIASNIVAGDDNAAFDIFLFDLGAIG
jgi:Tol biopolymer transport system component